MIFWEQAKESLITFFARVGCCLWRINLGRLQLELLLPGLQQPNDLSWISSSPAVGSGRRSGVVWRQVGVSEAGKDWDPDMNGSLCALQIGLVTLPTDWERRTQYQSKALCSLGNEPLSLPLGGHLNERQWALLPLCKCPEAWEICHA